MLTITCETEGCQNAGVEIEVQASFIDPMTGEEVEATSFICGPCEQPITNTRRKEAERGED